MQFIGQAIAHTGTFAAQLHRRLVKLKILAAQLGNMDQSVDKQIIQSDEDTERGNTGNSTGKLFANAFTDILALKPCFNVARRFIGTALIGRANDAVLRPTSMLLALMHHRLGGNIGRMLCSSCQLLRSISRRLGCRCR